MGTKNGKGEKGEWLIMIYIISQGIGSDGPWGVYERKPNGSLRRICSRYLPLRPTREESERDLTAWLEKQRGAKRA